MLLTASAIGSAVAAGRRRGLVSYAPDRGDVVWLEFDPQAGHEQARRRPALVLSPIAYNQRVGLALVCPITSRVKGYPFEVAVPSTEPELRGVILADQVKSLDWRARKATLLAQVTESTIEEVIGLIGRLLY